MDNLFKSKWFVRAIALFFAVALYVFVVDLDSSMSQEHFRYTPSNSEEVEKIEDMPVEIKIDKEQYVVSGVPKTVAVSLEGDVSITRPTAIQKNFDVFVDLRSLEEGEHRVEIEHGDLPRGLKAYIEPKTIDVTIERRATKDFDILVDFINEDQMASGLELDQYEIEPKVVTITSSQSVIEQIAVVKVFVDLKDVNDSIKNREVPINVYNNQGNELDVFIEPETAIVKVDMKRPSKKVSLELKTEGELKKGFTLNEMKLQDEVEVYGKRERLDEIEEIKTKPIQLNDIETSGKIDVPLDPPEDISTKEKEVTVEIDLRQEKKIEDVPIRYLNEPKNKKIEIEGYDQGTMELTITGDEKDINHLENNDFAIEIDLKNLSNGKHTLPVIVNSPAGINVKPKQEEVTVIISDK